MSEILKHDKPDAILTTSENKAKGIIESLLFLGYSQQDIPVITLGEEHWNTLTYSSASLSTLRPAIKIGATAASVLAEEIERPVVESKNIIFSDRLAKDNLDSYPLFREAVYPKSFPCTELNILMLDTMQTHALVSILNNFSSRFGIKCRISVVPHQKLFDRIMEDSQNHKKPPMSSCMISLGSRLSYKMIFLPT